MGGKSKPVLVWTLLINLAILPFSAVASEKAVEKPVVAPVDFLAGNWRILDADGKEIGHSTIVAQAPGNMLFEERAVGKNGAQALWLMNSEKYGGWTQLFVSVAGVREFPPQSGPGEWPLVMGAPVTLRNGDKVVFRLTVSRTSDDESRRVLEISRDRGATWKTFFDYTYVRVQQ